MNGALLTNQRPCINISHSHSSVSLRYRCYMPGYGSQASPVAPQNCVLTFRKLSEPYLVVSNQPLHVMELNHIQAPIPAQACDSLGNARIGQYSLIFRGRVSRRQGEYSRLGINPRTALREGRGPGWRVYSGH